MAQDTLDIVAGKINALTEKLSKASEDIRKYRATRNQLIKEAYERRDEMPESWDAWVTANLTISRRATYLILALPKPQDKIGEQVHHEETVEPEAVQAAVEAMRSSGVWTGTKLSTEVEVDPIDRIMTLVKQLSLEDTKRLDAAFHAHKVSIGLVQQRTKPQKSHTIYPEPTDEELNAVERFFAFEPGKRAWITQRFDEAPSLLQPGPHCDWITAFWGRPKDFQEAVKLTIKRREETAV